MIKITLVKTKTCVYCPAASRMWNELRQQYKFDYEEVDATTPKGQELVMKFAIFAVPTTIIERDGKQSVAFMGLPNKERAVDLVKGG